MSNYYIKDGQFHEIPDDVLMHWKYIKRKKVNGKWRYFYDDKDSKTQISGAKKFVNIPGTKKAVYTYEQNGKVYTKSGMTSYGTYRDRTGNHKLTVNKGKSWFSKKTTVTTPGIKDKNGKIIRDVKTATVIEVGKMSQTINGAKRWLESLKNRNSGGKKIGSSTSSSKSKNTIGNTINNTINKIGDVIGFDDKKAYDNARADMSRARVRAQDRNLTGGERTAAAKQYEQARKKSEGAFKNYMDTPLSFLTNTKDKFSKLSDKMSDIGDEISNVGDKVAKRIDVVKNKTDATKAKNDLIDGVKNYEKLTDKRDELEQQVNKTKRSLDSAETVRKRRATDLNRAKMTNLGLDSAKREYQKAAKEVEKAREQYNKAIKQYDDNDSEIKVLKKKLDNLSVGYRNAYDDYEDVMDRISVELGRDTKWKPTSIPTGITSSSRRR